MQHGLAGLRIHRVWVQMHQRCNNPEDEGFYWYGARGISICDRWNDVCAFLADMGHPPAGLTIGRIDNDGNYEPGNCRWETVEAQLENYRGNKFLELGGEERIIKLWAKEYDRDPRRVSERVRRGWSVSKALETPTPMGYEEARQQHCARAKETWASSGRRYAANARARREGRAPRPVAAANTPEPSIKPPAKGTRVNGRCTTEVQARVMALHAQGLGCRAIAEQVPIGKSSVAALIRAAV